ncbi:hypothetical protein BDV30DRAFT_214812 [Aspergillus minisclerotigenes]|uniref:Uncharacterized protein n=1 Tax=Aspergillus minisclerotigenes TaxID=656917 RepID=A0A5N6IXK6_9EURO|nr:hypothetical protein BDV30DRAFT_214812 [Aspergillus minisclerotigenes]
MLSRLGRLWAIAFLSAFLLGYNPGNYTAWAQSGGRQLPMSRTYQGTSGTNECRTGLRRAIVSSTQDRPGIYKIYPLKKAHSTPNKEG